MDKPEISIVIPIYNNEKYLSKCIDSILSQTFENFELLLINDGSTDGSKIVCNQYSKKDKRIIFIDKENTGSADTRNIGIYKARGKYICFIDSDDWIEEHMLEEKLKLAIKYNAEMVISGISRDTVDLDTNVKSSINSYKFSIWDTPEKVQHNIINLFPTALINSSCNKLYNLNFLKAIKALFPNTNIGEDTLFNLQIIKYIKSIVITDKSYYHYMKYENNETLTNIIIEDAYERYIYIHETMELLFEFWNKKTNEIESKIKETMFCQYYATTLKILNSDRRAYPYKLKKKLLDKGLKHKAIIDTFDYNRSFSYKEKILKFTIKNRLYSLSIILLKLSRIRGK